MPKKISMAENDKIELSTLLPQTTPEQIKQLCEAALANDIKRICVSPYFVPNGKEYFGGDTSHRVISCIGYPYGFSITSSKVEEIKRVINQGADEIDMVLNVSAIKSKNDAYLKNDIDSCIRISHLHGRPLSVALKMNILTREEIEGVCKICNNFEIDYINMHFDDEISTDLVLFVKNVVKNIKLKITGSIDIQIVPTLVEQGVEMVSTSNY